jgi:uncharacterized protein with GYD domain
VAAGTRYDRHPEENATEQARVWPSSGGALPPELQQEEEMPTYIMLTRLTPEAVKTPGELKRLEKVVADHVRRDCPQVKWVANYAILGPYDYLDIFEAPDETTAAKVVMIIRSYGHGQTETWTAMPWERFEIVLPR